MPADILSELCQFYNSWPGDDGEVFTACPFCNAPSSKQHVHFSFSEKGFYCFRCQANGPLKDLAKFAGIDSFAITPQIAPIRREKDWPWLHNPWRHVNRWHSGSGAFDAWQEYKPISQEAFQSYHLGLGKLPQFSSRCYHPRLTVPIIVNNKVIGIRARQLSCSCQSARWLSPGGSKIALFNGERLLHPLARGKRSEEASLAFTPTTAWARNKILLIVENPVDAIMAEEYLGLQAIATMGVANWREDWTFELSNAKPKLVICMYDNDVPGNGTNAQGQQEWLRTHDRLITPNGVKLTSRLQAAGINAIMFHWPDDYPLKSDIGDLMISNIRKSLAKGEKNV